MNIAFSRTTNRIESIEHIEKGSPYLLDLASQDFKCFDEVCNAQLTLCSYFAHNIPPAYFRAVSIHDHRPGCPGLIESTGVSFEDRDITERRCGRSAFNKMLRILNGEETRISTWDTSTHRRYEYNSRNTQNTPSRSTGIKTGPIIYTPDTDVQVGLTYIASLADIEPREAETGLWINLRGNGNTILGVGLRFDDASIIRNGVDNTMEVIFICRYISRSEGGRKYSTAFDYIIKNEDGLLCRRIFETDRHTEHVY